MTFGEVLLACAANDEFVAGFDRLTSSNLERLGSPLDRMIDEATGRQDVDAAKFIAFVWDVVWCRLPPGVRDTSGANS